MLSMLRSPICCSSCWISCSFSSISFSLSRNCKLSVRFLWSLWEKEFDDFWSCNVIIYRKQITFAGKHCQCCAYIHYPSISNGIPLNWESFIEAEQCTFHNSLFVSISPNHYITQILIFFVWTSPHWFGAKINTESGHDPISVLCSFSYMYESHAAAQTGSHL